MQKALKRLAESNIEFDSITTSTIIRLIEIAYLEGQLNGIDQAKALVEQELGVK